MARLIPELNLKLNFTGSGYHLERAVGVGCQASTMAGISLLFANPAIEWLEPTKDKLWKDESYYGSRVIAPNILRPLLEYLEKHPITVEDAPDLHEKVVAKASSIPIWFISDVINTDAPARGGTPNVHTGTLDAATSVPLPIGRTQDFARYLIDKKIGYIVETPIVQNPLHRVMNNYSLNMAWLWIPPNHLPRVHGRASEYGKENIPSEKEWIETLAVDLRLKPEDVLKSVFKDEVMPERRFIRPAPRKAKAA